MGNVAATHVICRELVDVRCLVLLSWMYFVLSLSFEDRVRGQAQHSRTAKLVICHKQFKAMADERERLFAKFYDDSDDDGDDASAQSIESILKGLERKPDPRTEDTSVESAVPARLAGQNGPLHAQTVWLADDEEKAVDGGQVVPAVVQSEGEETKPRRITLRQKLTFAGIAIMNMSSLMSFSVLAPFFPNEAEKKGVSPTEIGFIFGFFALVSFICSPILGKYLPVIGAKFMFLSGSFLSAGCNILYGFLNGIHQKNMFLAFCFTIRAFEALGSAATVTSGMAIVAQVFPDNVAQYDGMLELFSGFGFAIGPPLGSLFYGIGGYRLPFIVLGTTSLVLTIIDMWILPSVGSLSGAEKPGSLLNVASVPAIWVVLIGSVWSSACIGFIDPTLSVHLTNPPLKVSSSLVGVLFLLVGGGYGIMAPILGYIGDKTKATRIMMVLGFYFIGLSYMFLGPSPLLNLPKQLWVIIIALSLLGISNSLASMPAFLDLILSAQWYGLPDDFSTQGVLSGLFNGSYALGTFIGPTLAGVLVDKVGFDWAVTVFAAGNFLMMIIIALFSAWEFQWGKGKRKPEHLRTSDTSGRLARDESSINA